MALLASIAQQPATPVPAQAPPAGRPEPVILVPPTRPAPAARTIPVDYTAISVVFTLFVLSPMSIAFARWLWRLSTPAKRASIESEEQLQRLEHSVDAIALELERVSEGQRFLTRVLTDDRRPASAPAERQLSPQEQRPPA
jgi:hypothetical protein